MMDEINEYDSGFRADRESVDDRISDLGVEDLDDTRKENMYLVVSESKPHFPKIYRYFQTLVN